MATFTSRPSEHEYPWFGKREAYDVSLQNAINANELKANAALPVRPMVLTGDDFNTLTALGVYPINYGTHINSPRTPGGGSLEVLPITSAADRITQRYTPYVVPGNARGGSYTRSFQVDAWSHWTFQPVQRVDNTAGHAIYTWDETANREQRTGGDTGVRDISGLIVGSTGTAQMRRYGDLVEIAFNNLNATAWTGTTTLPNGFRPSGTTRTLIRLSGVAEGRLLALTNGNLTGDKAYFQGAYSTTYFTTDPWPTTLPGTAIGTIPFN